jgi:hypothetical protein
MRRWIGSDRCYLGVRLLGVTDDNHSAAPDFDDLYSADRHDNDQHGDYDNKDRTDRDQRCLRR